MKISKDIFHRYLRTSLLLLLKNPLRLFPELITYFFAYGRIRSMGPEHTGFTLQPAYPCLSDKYESVQKFGRYVYQDSWAFRHVSDFKPKLLVDVGSSRYFVGFAAQIVNVIFVDIRPLQASMDAIDYKYGDITQLPFKDESVEAISTLSVIEHIGLGRYGDKVDLYGMQKAAKELVRVLQKNGLLLVSFPVGSHNTIQFNAHRVCTPETAFDMFSELKVIDERYALSDRIVTRDIYEESGRPYAYGCYRLTKT